MQPIQINKWKSDGFEDYVLPKSGCNFTLAEFIIRQGEKTMERIGYYVIDEECKLPRLLNEAPFVRFLVQKENQVLYFVWRVGTQYHIKIYQEKAPSKIDDGYLTRALFKFKIRS